MQKNHAVTPAGRHLPTVPESAKDWVVVVGAMVLLRGGGATKGATRGRRRPLVTWLTLRSVWRTRKMARKSPHCSFLVRHWCWWGLKGS